MKHPSMRRWIFAGLASLVLMMGMVGGVRAQDDVAVDGVAAATLDDPGEPDRAIGVFGAAVCGAEMWLIRANPVVGMNPWILGVGIGGCALMLLDMFT